MAAIMQKVGGAAVVAGGLGLMFANDCYYTVEPGHRAVMFNRLGGVGNEVVAEGLHLKLPFFQWPLIYSDCLEFFSRKSGNADRF